MKGIERIIARVESDAEEEIGAILSEAKKEATQMEEQYRSRGEALRAELLAQGEKRVLAQRERMVSEARMEGRKRILAQRQEMVEEAARSALTKLCQLPRKDAVDTLTALLLAVSSGGGEVILSSTQREKIGKEAVEKANAAGRQLTLSEKTLPLQGGFILREGKVEINCAFETLVRLEKERSAAEVAKILFRSGVNA